MRGHCICRLGLKGTLVKLFMSGGGQGQKLGRKGGGRCTGDGSKGVGSRIPKEAEGTRYFAIFKSAKRREPTKKGGNWIKGYWKQEV